jgi:hypothetical protein
LFLSANVSVSHYIPSPITLPGSGIPLEFRTPTEMSANDKSSGLAFWQAIVTGCKKISNVAEVKQILDADTWVNKRFH